jgi:tricorn protease-like protein
MNRIRTAIDKAKPFFIVLALFAVCATAAAQTAPSWLRYPAISPDGKTIVFTYKGDLYRVASNGGTAVPLTLHEAYDYMPVWSHDGKSIAFASDRFGNFDIFVMPAAGGQPRRLTFHSASELPFSFSPDDKDVLFGAARLDTAANRLFPAGSQPELYKVPVAGGRALQVLATPAEDARYSRDGRFIIYHDKKAVSKGRPAVPKSPTSARGRSGCSRCTSSATCKPMLQPASTGDSTRLWRSSASRSRTWCVSASARRRGGGPLA